MLTNSYLYFFRARHLFKFFGLLRWCHLGYAGGPHLSVVSECRCGDTSSQVLFGLLTLEVAQPGAAKTSR